MAVRIRMKMLGRKHRPYFRIVAIDSRQPRDGRIIEELGSYDPLVKNTDERVRLKPERIKYWLGVGAKPSDHRTPPRRVAGVAPLNPGQPFPPGC